MAKKHQNEHFKQAAIKKKRQRLGFWGRFSKKRLMQSLVTLGIALLLLIPTYIAIGDYLYRKAHPFLAVDTVYSSLKIIGPEGTPIDVELGANQASDTLLSLLSSILSNAEHVDEIPYGYATNYVLVAETNLGPEEYRLAFSIAEQECYFIDKNGDFCHAKKEDAQKFLKSPFAYELYPQAKIPSLLTALSDEIIPTELSWSYRVFDQTFTDRTQLDLTEQTLIYPIANEVAFHFSLAPSSCLITIRHGDKVYTYTQNDAISLTQLSEGDLLDCEIIATYENTPDCDYHGSATYRFKLNVVEAAKFEIDATTKVQGDYFILACKNVENIEKLTVSTEPAPVASPIRWKQGDTVYVAIPAAELGARRLTVGYGTLIGHFDLTVSKKTTAQSLTLAADALRGDWQKALSGGIADKIRAKGASLAGDTMTPGSFAAIAGADISPLCGFGDTLTLADTALTDTPLPFELYRASTRIVAGSYGVVKEVGNDDILGGYVIVDHGCGLYTWYCGLDEIYLSAGMPVAVGDALGTAGSTGLGLADTTGVLVMVTLGKEAIDPASLRNDGFLPQ